jgi:hypothetical protein
MIFYEESTQIAVRGKCKEFKGVKWFVSFVAHNNPYTGGDNQKRTVVRKITFSKKSLKFDLICFDIPASNCFICLVCNFHILTAGLE